MSHERGWQLEGKAKHSKAATHLHTAVDAFHACGVYPGQPIFVGAKVRAVESAVAT
jgi:hypothetical protein